jgi:hypothetical protein
MNRRRVLKGVMAAAAALPLAGCETLFPWHWRQKLVLTVETPSGVAVGSAVAEVSWARNYVFKDGPSYYSDIEGEAPVVDLGGGRFLFALLSHGNEPDYTADLFMELVRFGREEELRGFRNIFHAVQNSVGPQTVPPQLYPMLVTFADLTDPKSVRQVLPDELAKHFGAGVTLKSITLEITDEPVTEGAVEKVIPWIWKHRGDLKPYTDRLGPGLAADSEVLPIEKIQRIDFIRRKP